MATGRISESELILPSLFLMLQNKGSITTSQLIEDLTRLLNPVGIDAQILPNRTDTYFSQKVRNLKSHDALVRRGYAKNSEGCFIITSEGRQFVEDNADSILYLTGSGFNYTDVRKIFGRFANDPNVKRIPYAEVIAEGGLQLRSSYVRQRSRKLRDAAMEHFTKDGVIRCDCCGFEFKEFYGVNYGSPCIEIHHLKPIFSYEDSNIQKTIDEALKNLIPVCPNCHRVIHRNNIQADAIPAFRSEILQLHAF